MISGEPQELPLSDSFRSLEHSRTDFISHNILLRFFFVSCYCRLLYKEIAKHKNHEKMFLALFNATLGDERVEGNFSRRIPRLYIYLVTFLSLRYECRAFPRNWHYFSFLARQGTIDFLQLFLSGVFLIAAQYAAGAAPPPIREVRILRSFFLFAHSRFLIAAFAGQRCAPSVRAASHPPLQIPRSRRFHDREILMFLLLVIAYMCDCIARMIGIITRFTS